MRRFRFFIAVLIAFSFTDGAVGQFRSEGPAGASLGEMATQRWRIGFVITATGQPVRNLVASQTVPMDWPEQTVKIVGQDVSPGVSIDYQAIRDAARQMVVKVPLLPAGATVRAVVTFEVRRGFLLEPENTAEFTVPSRRQMPRAVADYLRPGPMIESTHRVIRDLADEIDPKDAPAWQRVEAIHDWVRENIEFVDNQGAEPVDTPTTLKARNGDCDEMSCLFIALCRASGIPARLVQVPGHVHAEFYLLDGEGEGCWLPCQLAGTRAFGEMPEHRPVLQKGDNLTSSHTGRKPYLILPQHATASSGQPTVRMVMEQVGE